MRRSAASALRRAGLGLALLEPLQQLAVRAGRRTLLEPALLPLGQLREGERTPPDDLLETARPVLVVIRGVGIVDDVLREGDGLGVHLREAALDLSRDLGPVVRDQQLEVDALATVQHGDGGRRRRRSHGGGVQLGLLGLRGATSGEDGAKSNNPSHDVSRRDG